MGFVGFVVAFSALCHSRLRCLDGLKGIKSDSASCLQLRRQRYEVGLWNDPKCPANMIPIKTAEECRGASELVGLDFKKDTVDTVDTVDTLRMTYHSRDTKVNC